MIETDQQLRLLNPGPVCLSQRVRQAMLRPDLCHREPEFARLWTDVAERLANVYPEAADDYSAVLLTGSGTAAVEAMVTSLVPRDGKAMVLANGVYGERMATMLEIHGKPFHVVRSDWTDPMDVETVERLLASDTTFTHVLAVHHETTTGRLNDLAALGRLCREHDVPLLLDTVSSFGGEEIDFSAWNVEACAATANKCLHGAPGISFVIVRNRTLRERTSSATSLYLDLFRHDAAQRSGAPAFTPAVHVLQAFREALIEFEEAGGWPERNRHYAGLTRRVLLGLGAMGIRPLLADDGDRSSILTMFDLPDGVEFDQLHERLKAAGFVIYAGQQQLRGSVFRIAVMGDLSEDDMDEFLNAMSTVVKLAPTR